MEAGRGQACDHRAEAGVTGLEDRGRDRRPGCGQPLEAREGEEIPSPTACIRNGAPPTPSF